jgi:hypothetical protein
MKKIEKFSVALLALATIFAITPTAFADTFSFTYTDGSTADATGTLTGTGGSNGVFDLTSGTIDVSYDGGAILTGELDTNPADMAAWGNADNLLYPSSNSPNGLLLDDQGLEFLLSNGVLVNMWGGDDNGNVNPATLANYSVTQQDWVDYPGTFDVSETPEPSSLLLLGTGLVGLAGLARRKLAK